MGAFKPTTEWQDVPEGAEIPEGCVRSYDLETGRRRARLDVPPPPHGNGTDPADNLDFDTAYQKAASDPKPEPWPEPIPLYAEHHRAAPYRSTRCPQSSEMPSKPTRRSGASRSN